MNSPVSWFFAAGFIATIFAAAVAGSRPIEGPARVIDGDTIEIGETRIRLWGLDAPELSTEEGRTSKETLIRLIGSAPVRCVPDGSLSYGRVVAVCFVGRIDLADAMIRAGAARPYCRYSGDYYDGAARAAGLKPCVRARRGKADRPPAGAGGEAVEQRRRS